MTVTVCLLLNFSTPAFAKSSIEFSGKFKDKIILVIDGKSRMLTPGQTSPEGIKVIQVEGDTVTLDVNGKSRKLKLGESNAFKTQYIENQVKEVIISLNNQGQFLTAGYINKHMVGLLIDTGANTVALNSGHAKRLGIDYLRHGTPTMVSTASGVTKAYQVVLDSVSVGEITLPNVKAVVIEGNYPAHILLGMTFLGNLEIYREKQIMTLKKKW